MSDEYTKAIKYDKSKSLPGFNLIASVKQSTAFWKSPSDIAIIASDRFSFAASWSSSDTTLFGSPSSGGSSVSGSVREFHDKYINTQKYNNTNYFFFA